MTKFFAQLLLSILVGAGAAATLNADVKDTLAQGLNRAQAFLQDVAQPELELAGETDLSAQAGMDGEVEADVEISADAEVEVDTHVRRFFRRISNVLNGAEAETTLAAESESDLELSAGAANLELEHDLEADLEISVGP